MAKGQRRKLGNIYAIPLPDGTYAFGRLHKGVVVAIAKEKSLNMNDIPDFRNIDFFVSVYNDVLTDGEWPKVGYMPFSEGEDIIGPKTYIYDNVADRYEIYYDGVITIVPKEECLGLEVTAVWDRHHVVDRLMGNDKWTKICK